MRNRFPDRLSRLRDSAHTDRVPDEEDRSLDASSAADPGWADALAPDDIRELARDIQAYRREQRAERRRERFHWLYLRPGAAPMSLAVAALALAAIIATVLTVMAPASGRPSPLPLAHSAAAAGTRGSVLTNVSLADITGTKTPVELLRPAVMAVIPLNCGCQPLLSALAAHAAVARLKLVVVAPKSDAEAGALSGRIGSGRVYYDTTGAMHSDFGASGVTVVLLDRDGTVFSVQPNVTAQPGNLVPLLQQMLQGKRD